MRAAAPAGVSALAGWGGGGPAGGRAPAAYGPAREAATTPVPSPLPPPAAMPAPEFSASPAPAARVAAALAQLAASLPPEHLLRGQLADALPLAEATMRVLTEAWRARQQAEAEGWVPADH